MNTGRSKKIIIHLLLMFVFISLASPACSESTNQEDFTLTPSPIPLTPYLTTTPTSTIQPVDSTNASDQALTDIENPTPTPFTYTIQAGDFLSVIAQRHGVTLEELLAANPGVDPNFLIVGNEIIIPTGDGEIVGVPVVTPVAVTLDQPNCYLTVDNGTWCLVLVSNQQAYDLENISAMLSVLTPDGNLIDKGVAISPLNLLPIGETIALTIFFPFAFQDNYWIQTDLITSLPVSPDNQRYVDLVIEVENVEYNDKSAIVRGSASIPESDDTAANLIWLTIIAYDAGGQPVGIRKYQQNIEITPGALFPFEITVYSLGDSITEVDVLGEARP